MREGQKRGLPVCGMGRVRNRLVAKQKLNRQGGLKSSAWLRGKRVARRKPDGEVDDRRTNGRANPESGHGDGEGSSVIFGIDGNMIGEAGRSIGVFAGTRERETGKSRLEFVA